ncbi:MAG: DNA helicase, partial [Betaproteobacteria bacterium]|nr:DNA helicase [Betaproteobacteria bacterium]
MPLDYRELQGACDSAAASRYENQLARVREGGKRSSLAIEAAIKGAIENIGSGERSFVIYGEPQSGKTEMMICLTARLLDDGFKWVVLLLNDSVDLLDQNLTRF